MTFEEFLSTLENAIEDAVDTAILYIFIVFLLSGIIWLCCYSFIKINLNKEDLEKRFDRSKLIFSTCISILFFFLVLFMWNSISILAGVIKSKLPFKYVLFSLLFLLIGFVMIVGLGVSSILRLLNEISQLKSVDSKFDEMTDISIFEEKNDIESIENISKNEELNQSESIEEIKENVEINKPSED